MNVMQFWNDIYISRKKGVDFDCIHTAYTIQEILLASTSLITSNATFLPIDSGPL